LRNSLSRALPRALLGAALVALGLALPVVAAAPAGGLSTAGSGTEVDCAAVDPTFAPRTTVDNPDGSSSESCEVTLTAAVSDPAGWAFDHRSGDCTGTAATCTVTTEESECDPQFKPVCHTTAYDVKPVALFRDTRTPPSPR
jgi:hypothetical protein